MKTQRTTQSNGSRNNHYSNGNGNRVDFAREIQSTVANQICLARQANPQITGEEVQQITENICNKKINDCLDKVRFYLEEDSRKSIGYWIAYAYAWAKAAGFDIAEKINKIYEEHNSRVGYHLELAEAVA